MSRRTVSLLAAPALFLALGQAGVSHAAEPGPAPQVAPAPAPKPSYDFTLGVVSGLGDVGLQFGFRVTDHFAWSFDLGASFLDKVGFSAGLNLNYYVADDFRGFYVGFGGQVAEIDADIKDPERALGDRSTISAYFGHKWIIDPGFTIDLQIGPGLRYAADTTKVNGVEVTTTTLAPSLVSRLALGWSF